MYSDKDQAPFSYKHNRRLETITLGQRFSAGGTHIPRGTSAAAKGYARKTL